MPLSLKQTGAPVAEPLTKDEVRLHSRIDVSDENTELDRMIASARRFAESYTRRQLMTATWQLSMDGFPGSFGTIELPRPNLQSVTSITYLDPGGVSTVMPSSDYRVDTQSEPGRITPEYTDVWPSTRGVINDVEIVYVSGYGDASAVPEDIKHAMLMLIGHWYENRESVLTGTISKQLEFSVSSLLYPYRVPTEY